MRYSDICSWDNLLAAYHAARRGKRGREEVAAFEYHREDNLIALQTELQSRSYRPGAYRSFHIHEPKRRLISAAPFRDRVLHHALVCTIEPGWERRFIFDSYANRKGRGTHAALDRCQYFARRSCYVLQCDVRQFFPSMDHALLRAALASAGYDAGTMWLIDRVLESGRGVLAGEYEMAWFPGDDLWAALRPRGLPIGNQTSQFWANVYLNELDQFVKRALKCKRYLRYVDDFLLFADDKATLHKWRQRIIDFMAALRLTIHVRRAQPRPVTEGIPFLGFTVYPDYRRLKRQKWISYRRKLKGMLRAYAHGELPIERLSASVQGWVNHARYGDTWGLRKSLFEATVS